MVGWRDISKEPYAGSSGDHKREFKAVEVSNGSDPHNVQLFFISPDGIVLHALPGFWRADDLLHEMKLAEALHKLWQNRSLSREDKERQFSRLQRAHVRTHSKQMRDRSPLQWFDAWEEQQKPTSDFATGRPGVLRTVDEVVHLRMARQAFVPFERFDIRALVDYGKLEYDAETDDHEDRESGGDIFTVEAVDRLRKDPGRTERKGGNGP